MRLKKVLLLILSSLANLAVCVSALFFAVFATNPSSHDVAMRIGSYLLYLIAIVAFFSAFIPWGLAYKERNKLAIIASFLPILIMVLAAVVFSPFLFGWMNVALAN